jgi:hypothetical protein
MPTTTQTASETAGSKAGEDTSQAAEPTSAQVFTPTGSKVGADPSKEKEPTTTQGFIPTSPQQATEHFQKAGGQRGPSPTAQSPPQS